MKIPLKFTFKDLEGKEIVTDQEGKNKLTMRDVCIVALTNEFKEDQEDLSNIVTAKLQRFALFQKFHTTSKEDDHVELTVDDAAYLKPRVARCFGVLVSGYALQILDGK